MRGCFRPIQRRSRGDFASKSFTKPASHAVFVRCGRRWLSKKTAVREIFEPGLGLFLEITASPILDDGGEVTGIVHVAKDITARKQAENDLKLRNVLLSTQQEVSLDAILVVDENGRIVLYNRRFVEIMDIPPELLEHKTHEPSLQFVANKMANPQQFLQRIQYLYEHKKETSRDEIILKDGRILDRYSGPMFGDDGTYYGRVWYFRDITAGKRAVQEVMKLAAIVQSSDDAITSKSLDGIIAPGRWPGAWEPLLLRNGLNLLRAVAPFTLPGEIPRWIL